MSARGTHPALSAGLFAAAPFLIAQLLDRAAGDPESWHPVAGFGRFAVAAEGRMYRDNRLAGVGFVAFTVGMPVAAATYLQHRLGKGRSLRDRSARAASAAVLTWGALGGASLVAEGQHVSALLDNDDLTAARTRLRHLCARDPAELDSSAMARATVESIAENTSDAVVAPLWWLLIGGLPGVVGYRAVNTLDAMVGYHSPRYERFGWAAARTDDLANLIPARMTGALAVLLAPAIGGSSARSWRTMRADARKHPSPNAGYPEAAFAGAMDVRLGGLNSYGGVQQSRATLGDGRAVERRDIAVAARLSSRVGELATIVLAAAALVRRALRHRQTSRAKALA